MGRSKPSGNVSDINFDKLIDIANVLDPGKVVMLTVNTTLDKFSTSHELTPQSALAKEMFSNYRKTH